MYKTPLTLSASALLAMVALGATARAEVLTFDSEVTTVQGNALLPIELPSFDPVHGELDEVRIDVALGVEGGVGWENLSTGVSEVTTTFGAAGVLRTKSGTALASCAATIEATWIAGPFDGKLDYRGTSGHRDPELATGTTVSVVLPAAVFEAGTGILPHGAPVELMVETVDLTQVLAAGQTAVRRGQATTVEVTITYVYSAPGSQD